MSYSIQKPSLSLSKYIKYYWSIENHLKKGEKHTQRIVPNGLVELIVYLRDIPKSVGDSKLMNESALITGQLNNYYDILVAGHLSLFSIVFQPCGLSAFFDVPINEFYNQNVPLKFLSKELSEKLEDELSKVSTFNQQVRVAEYFLIGLLANRQSNYNYKRIENSLAIVNQSRGAVEIEELASETCLSRKQFERLFKQYVGTSPKRFLKVVRFQNAISQKSYQPNYSLTGLSHLCGYYDQSHMVNDFSQLSGMTPKQYFDSCEPFSDYFH